MSSGRHKEATVTKAITIRGSSGATIVSGPVVNAYGRAGFLFAGAGQGSGAPITSLHFLGVAFDYAGGTVTDNLIAENTILGRVSTTTA